MVGRKKNPNTARLMVRQMMDEKKTVLIADQRTSRAYGLKSTELKNTTVIQLRFEAKLMARHNEIPLFLSAPKEEASFLKNIIRFPLLKSRGDTNCSNRLLA
jgi:hypothetical protein